MQALPLVRDVAQMLQRFFSGLFLLARLILAEFEQCFHVVRNFGKAGEHLLLFGCGHGRCCSGGPGAQVALPGLASKANYFLPATGSPMDTLKFAVCILYADGI